MRFYDVIDKAAHNGGMSYRAVSAAMGRTANYVAAMKTQGRMPSVENAAQMLNACNYELCAVPVDSVPPDALVIDAGDGK